MVLLIILLILAPIVYLWWTQNERFKLDANIPGPKPYPIVGNTFSFLFIKSEDLFQVIVDLKKKYGNLYRMFVGHELWIVVSGAKDLETCLSNQKLLLKSNDYTFIEPFVGKGLLTSTGSKWHTRRKAITPAFHFKILEQFPVVMDEQVAVLIDKWKGKLGEFDICEDITLLSMDIICETSMGVSIKAQTTEKVPYYLAIRSLIRIAHQRMFKPYLQPEFIFKLTKMSSEFNKSLKIIEDFNNEIITQRRKELANRQIEDDQEIRDVDDDDQENIYLGTKKRKMVLMDILLQSHIDGKPLTDEEVREEANTFLFAGHDTVSSALMFLFYNIARYQDIQDKLFAEIKEVFGEDQEITFGKLANLIYLECVIKESLRIYPPVPMFGRESQEEIKLKCGTVLPVGSNITLCPLLVHMDPDIFPEPEKFNPDRFVNENFSPVDGRGFTYIPFSAGPRGCIGQRLAMQEMKIVTLRVLQSLSFRLPKNQPPLEIASEIVMKPRNGIQLIVSKRQ